MNENSWVLLVLVLFAIILYAVFNPAQVVEVARGLNEAVEYFLKPISG